MQKLVGTALKPLGHHHLATCHQHLRGRPLERANGASEEEQQRQVVADLSAWLFSPNGSDPGQVERH